MIRQVRRLAFLGALGIAAYDMRSSDSIIHKQITTRLILNSFDDPDKAHQFLVNVLTKYKTIVPRDTNTYDQSLSQQVFGLEFDHPLGLAAGFDRNGDAVDALIDLGFSFVEIGTVSTEPRKGTDTSYFLKNDEALIINDGEASEGSKVVASKLSRRFRLDKHDGVIGVNLDKQALQEGALRMAKYADFLVINVSNTEDVEGLINTIHKAKDSIPAEDFYNKSKRPPFVLIKVSPDMSDKNLKKVCNSALKCKVDGIIVGNSTIKRPKSLTGPYVGNSGLLCGKPVKDYANEAMKKTFKFTKGQIPLIGSGGITTAEDAYERIRNGASLVQIYTALTYQGLSVIPEIKRGIEERLRADGFKNIKEAVGANHK